MRLGGHWWLPCGNTQMGKASHRGHEARGGRLVDAMRLGGHWWLPCGNTQMGKASHRGHGGHRGGEVGSTNALGWTLVVSVREHAYGKGIAQRSRRS